MSLSIEYIVADSEQAHAILEAPYPHESYRSMIRLDPVDPFSLAALATVLRGDSGPYPELASGGDDGPWVLQIPDTLIEQIASISDHDVKTIAGRWQTANHNWEGMAVESGVVEKILTLLRDIARTARATHKPLLAYVMP